MNSLRARLALWVLLPLAAALSLSIWFTHQDSWATAQARQDHRLWVSARIIASEIHWTGDHRLEASIPPVALEVLATARHDQAFFSVRTTEGQLLAGWPGFPAALPDSAGAPTYRNIRFQDQTLRAYDMSRDLFDSGRSFRGIVTVAQTREQLAAEAYALWWPNALRASGLLALVLVLMLLGLRHELKPLAALRDAVWNRERADLRPIRLTDLPLELRPVVDTVNQYAVRLQQQIDSRRRFIEDAAHQLRTPMTLLAAQLHTAASQADTPELKATLDALSQSRRQLTQLVTQLLKLSQVENLRATAPPREPVDLDRLIHAVLEELAPLAAQHDIDLGVTPGRQIARLDAYRPALHALLFNLLDNAIRYTPAGGSVTAAVHQSPGTLTLEIEDTGPGIPPELRAQVFARFNRGNADDQRGSGLGLAIAREAAAACGGTVNLHGGRQGTGLLVRVVFRVPAPS